MTLAMTRPWKHPKTGMYWLRKRVPEELRDVLGKREEKRSLKTKDPKLAKARLAEELALLEQKWTNLRRGHVVLSEIDAHELARPLYDHWIERHQANPSDQTGWNIERGVDGVWNDKDASLTTLDVETFLIRDRAYNTADKILRERGLSTDEVGRKRLARAVTAAVHRASVDLKQMALGGSTFPATHNGAATLSHSYRGVTLRDLLAGWAKEKSLGKKTLYDWTRLVGHLEQFLGHSDVGRIRSVDLNRWKAQLLESGLRAKTIRDGRLAPIRAILQWGVDNEKLATNPASKIVLGVKQKAGERKRGYTDDEAKQILLAARKEKSAPLRWLPWLSAFTGARIAELSQLRKEDVSEIEGILCLRIAPEAGSIKTVSSERVVPVHTALAKEGFLQFVASSKGGPLFPQLKPDKFGSRGGRATKILGQWVRSLGIDDRRISPSHSWRHRFKTLSRRHALSADIVDVLVGHAKKSVADMYGEFPIEALNLTAS